MVILSKTGLILILSRDKHDFIYLAGLVSLPISI